MARSVINRLIALGGGLLLAVVLSRIALSGALVMAFSNVSAGAVIAAGFLYLCSHGLRCIRLAIIATPMIKLSARTTALIQLYTAPLVLVLPWKLGELLRIQQLASASDRPIETIVAVVVERSLDVVCLLVICLTLLSLGAVATEKLATLIAILVVLEVLFLTTVIFAQPLLGWIQRYIFLRHLRNGTIWVLTVIDKLRNATQLGKACLEQNVAPLLLISMMIWTLEIMAMAALAVDASVFWATLQTIERLGSEWAFLLTPSPSSGIHENAPVINLAILAGLWPAIALVYLRRVQNPTRVMSKRIADDDA